jgi:tetratricopeptide (TPR) repeat protein
MQARHYLITALAGVVCLAAGFLIANKLNRSEFERLRAGAETVKTSTNSNSGFDLSEEEINAKLNEAAQSPDDLQFQKRLGISLYRFGTMKRDAAIIEKALVPLQRANSAEPDDKETIAALGNAYFDIGYFNKDNDSLVKSRDYYEILLNARPDDVETRTDLGLTFFLTEPPDLKNATKNFELSLAIDPKHEKTLQFYIQTLAKQNKTDKAKVALAKLREANPKNPALAELTTFIEQPTVQ